MSHNPEQDAASYLGGAMSQRRAEAFEQHLMECEDCWREVSEGRDGRGLAESARMLAPPQLREDIRAAVAAYDEPVPAGPRRWWLAVAAAALLMTGGFFVVVLSRGPHQPAAIAAAVSDFRTGRLPVAGTPARPAPDLSAAGLRLTTTGAGTVGDLAVDAYAYTDAGGHRVLLYFSDGVFPVAAGASLARDSEGPWTARDGDVELLCAQRPHSLLLLSEQRDALARAAQALGVD